MIYLLYLCLFLVFWWYPAYLPIPGFEISTEIPISANADYAISKMHIVEYHKAHKRVEVNAGIAEYFKAPNLVLLENVAMHFWDDDGSLYHFKADKAYKFIEEKEIIINNNVTVERSDGFKLSANHVLFGVEKSVLNSPQFTRIDYPEKNSKNAALYRFDGFGIFMHLKSHNIEINWGAHLKKLLNQKLNFESHSQKLIYDQEGGTLDLTQQVLLKFQDTEIASDLLNLKINKNQQIEKISSASLIKFKKQKTTLSSQGLEALYEISEADTSDLASVKCTGKTQAQLDQVSIDAEDIFLRYHDNKLQVAELPHYAKVKTKDKEASSDSALYYPLEERVVLIGNALLVTENSRVEGAKVTFFVNQDRIIVEKVLGRRIKE